MKTTIRISLLFYLLLFLPAISYGQSFFKNTLLTGHIALGAQDKRLFNHPQAANLLRLAGYNHTDYAFGFTMHKPVARYKFLQLTFGLGYMMSNTNFPRPFDHTKINGGFTDEPRTVKAYRIHQLILPATFNIYLNAKRSIFINSIFRPSFILNKTALSGRVTRASKTKFEYGGFEILPGIGAQIGQRWWFNLNYRWYYIYKIDRVLFYQALRPPQSFLEMEYDTYNPFQMQLTVGYWIRKK